jgi:DNA-binding transcriptional LysR family regulator
MTHKQIEYFLEVYRNGSVSLAAKNLYISRPVISRSLHELEAEVGARLFTRSLSGTAPTDAGDILYKMLDEFTRVYALTIERIRSANTMSDATELKIGIANGCGNWFYPLLYNRLKELYPDVNILVEGIPTENSSSLIIDGIIDAAIAPILNDTFFSLGSIYLYTAQWVLCTPNNKTYAEISEIPIADCKPLPLAILKTLPPPIYEHSNAVLSTREPEMVRIAVSKGFACAILPYELCGAWDDTRCIPFTPQISAPIHLLWNKSVPHSQTFDGLLKIVSETDFESLRKTNGLYIAEEDFKQNFRAANNPPS